MCYMEYNLLVFLEGNVNKIVQPHQRSFKGDNKARCKILITELKQHMKENKTKERILRLMKEFEEDRSSGGLIENYKKMDYELQLSIKGAVKKVGKSNFGYYRSPALTKAGKGVLVWKTIWSCRQRKQPLSKIIKNNIEVTGLSEKDVAKLTLKQIRIELRRSVIMLK